MSKLSLVIVVLLACALFFYAKFYNSAEPLIGDKSSSSQHFVSSASSSETISPPGVSSQASLSAFAESSAVSSLESFSGARVDPLPEIAQFLRKMDSASIPKLYLPEPKKNEDFDYAKATAAELKAQALVGDPYAAYRYAELIVRQQVRVMNDKGVYAYNLDGKKRDAAMSEAREFYIRGFRGGIKSIATVLSRFYEDPAHGGNRVESLAWRRIAFALGESERYDCLRNSTTCAVKDFNNLNRVENFYPCLSSSGDRCAQEEYDAAMVLAFQYADSLDFALYNKVVR